MKTFKILFSIFFMITFYLICTGCTQSDAIKEEVMNLSFSDIEGSIFIKGMKSAENIYLDDSSMRVYVGDLHGTLYLLDGPDYANLQIIKKVSKKGYFLGMDKGPDNNLYVAYCSFPDMKGWREKGGAVYKADLELESLTRISGEYKAINGLAVDDRGILYFSSSNFNYFFPKGWVYRMDLETKAAPELIIKSGGLANGLFFDKKSKTFFLSTTIKDVYSFTSSDSTLKSRYKGLKFMEAVDDLCSDSSGRLWMTDPGRSFIKCYDPAAKKLYRFNLDRTGQTSSCRIRREKGKDILYVTELKTTQNVMTGDLDGRGVIILPLDALTRFMK